MKTIKLVNRNQVIKLTHSGRRGPAGTITVGNVVTGDPGESVTITNVGTSTDAILNFVIPQGEQGDPATNIIQSVQGRTGDVVITKEDLNIENIDNTSDADKPVSTAQQTELDKKVDKVTGKALSTNDYTTPEKNKLAGIAAGAEVNVQSDWNASSGDAHILNKPTLGTAAATAATDYATAAQGAKADTAVQPATLTAHTSNTSNPHSVTKAQVGLGNVDNTSDADKPVSTAQQTALNAKADRLAIERLSTLITPITTFGADHGWTSSGDMTFDTTDGYMGYGSSIVITTPNTTPGGASASVYSLPPVDLTGKIPVIAFKVVNPHIPIYFGVFFSSNNMNSQVVNWSPSNNGELFRFGDWMILPLPWDSAGTPGAGFKRDAINSIRVSTQFNQASQAVKIGMIGYIDEPAKPVCTLTFDDASMTQYTVAKAKMDQYGMPGTLYTITSSYETNPSPSGKISLAQMMEMETRSGWDISSHTHTHQNLTALTPDQIDDEMRKSKEFLLRQGFRKGVDHIAYPGGGYNHSTVIPIVKKYYKTARTVASYGMTQNVVSPYTLHGHYVTVNDTVENLKGIVTKAIENNSWALFTFHKILSSPVSNDDWSVAKFNEFIDWLATQDIEVRTISDVTRTMQDTQPAPLVSGQNIKTVNGQSLLGAGNIPVVQQSDLDAKANIDHDHDTRYASLSLDTVSKSKQVSIPTSYGFLGQKFTNGISENDFKVFGETTRAGTPTPDAPAPLVSTTGNATIRSINKNIIGTPPAPGTFSGVTFTNNPDGSVTINGTATANILRYFTGTSVSLLPNTAYTLSGVTGGSGSTYRLEFTYNKDGVFQSPASYVGGNTFTTGTVNTGNHARYIYIANGSTVNNVTLYPQLEVGNVATPFEPFLTSTQTLPLGTTQLRSLPNGVSDRIYKDGSTWKLEQNVSAITVDGVGKTFSLGTTGGGHVRAITNISSELSGSGAVFSYLTAQTQMSSSFTAAASPAQVYGNGIPYQFLVTPSELYLIFPAATTEAAIKASLLANPATFIYQRATLITTTITDPTLITALENIRTYQGITNITASTPVSGSYGVLPATKTQMDTADALKVNKDGDTMTGRLQNSTSNMAISNTRGGKEILFGASSVGNFTAYDNTNGVEFFNAMSDGSGIRLGTSTGVAYLKGTGFPNGVVSAPVGSIYIDTAVTNGASSWIKKSGTGNTGWQVLEGDTGWRDVSALRDAFWSLGNLQVRRVGQEVYFRCWGVTVAISPSGLRTSGKTLLTTGSFPVGFRYASSWGTSTGWIGSVVLANRNGRVATGNSYEDLSASIPNGEATPGSWTAGDVVSGQFSYTTTDSWPTTLPGTAA